MKEAVGENGEENKNTGRRRKEKARENVRRLEEDSGKQQLSSTKKLAKSSEEGKSLHLKQRYSKWGENLRTTFKF